jgi:DNA-binding MarR family transcriptional regulator
MLYEKIYKVFCGFSISKGSSVMLRKYGGSVMGFSVAERRVLPRKKKESLRRLFVTTSESILLALLDGELHNNRLAEKVGLTPQHLVRVLNKLERYHLIFSRRVSVRRINRLTSLGRLLAENVRQRAEIIADIESGKFGLSRDELLEVYS